MDKRFVNSVSVRGKMKKTVCTGLLLMLCSIMASAQVKLSFNPASGAKYEYLTELVQNAKISVMGQTIPMETEMKGTFLMEIKDKTPQEIRVQMSYQKITFLLSSSVLKIKYDSKKPIKKPSETEKMFEKMFSKIIGKPFTVVFSPEGSVKSVLGMDVILKNMLEGLSGSGQMIIEQMNQLFSEESMKNTFEQSFNFYPDNAVKEGDSWNKEYTMPLGGINCNIKSKNTLTKINANMATVETTGDMDMDMDMEMGQGKFTGTQTGTMMIDTTTGLPATSDILLNMKGTLSTQGVDTQVEMVVKTKTEIKKIK
jgi:hypothetical protein